MEFKIEVTKNRIPLVLRTVEEKTYDALKLMGLQAERNAKINLEHDPRRIDTGNLRNSITHAIGGEEPAIKTYQGDQPSKYNGEIRSGSYSGATDRRDVPCVYVGTNVEYAPEVHYGTDRMAPNYFLRDAVYGHESEYIAIANKVFNGSGT